MNRRIPLTDGVHYAVVDDQDFADLAGAKWRFQCGYAARTTGPDGARTTELMHRVILGACEGQEVDHVDGDGLNNRRSNLRFATASQNKWNAAATGRTSRFKGVWLVSATGRFCSSIAANGKSIWIGSFRSEEEAAKAYDAAARRLHGSFATLNFPGPGEHSALRPKKDEFHFFQAAQ